MEEVPGTGTAIIALNRSYVQQEQSVLYQTLKKIGQKNALAEARRLFYVAVTRARKHLSMSGVIKPNTAGDYNFSANTPLAWLRRHYPDGELHGGTGTVNLWQQPPLQVRLFEADAEMSSWAEALDRLSVREEGRGAARPEEPEPDREETPAPPDIALPQPYDIQPEPWPYKIQLPSQLSHDPAVTETSHQMAQSPLLLGGEGQGEGGDTDPVHRLRGEISHRLLDTLARGGALPEAAAVAPALQTVSNSSAAALDLAREILAEIRACQADPFLAPLLSPNLPVARSEWLLEAWHDGNTLYRGQIDRLVYDGRQWWLLDYKTSRPADEENWPDFIAAELKKYRPQLLAYREMAARFYQVDPPELIQTGLYFTAGRRHVLI